MPLTGGFVNVADPERGAAALRDHAGVDLPPLFRDGRIDHLPGEFSVAEVAAPPTDSHSTG